MEEERPASGEGDSVVESDMDSALEEEDMVEGETEAEETDEEGRKLGSGQLILTEIANDVIEAEDSRESNSSSSKSDEKKSDDDSRGRSKARDTPSPPMSRKRRIQDIQQADDGKPHAAMLLPTDLEIREGKDFQALVPDYIEHGDEERATEAEKEICHWMPLEDAEAPKIDAYCNDCEAEFGLDRHQSLYMLQKTFYDYEKAKELCQKRTSLKEEWSAEDKNLFQHYLSVFGKNFSRIRTAMPHKSAAALIQHYYNTKKTQFTKSFFDVDHASHKEEEMYDESSDEDEGHSNGSNGSREASQDSSQTTMDSQEDSNGEFTNLCSNCSHHVNRLFDMDEGKLCATCYTYLQRYNKMRPCQDLSASHHTKLSHEMADIVAGFHRHAHLVEEEQQKEGMMKVGRIIVGKRYVVDEDLGKVNKSLQEVHARIAQIEKKISDFDFRGSDRLVDGYRKVAGVFTRPPSLSKMREEWTDREMTIAFHALMIYGNDYHRVSSFIRTKSAEQVKEFADKYREELERLEEKQNGEDEENGEEGPPVLTIEENVEESAKEMSFEENGEAVAQN